MTDNETEMRTDGGTAEEMIFGTGEDLEAARMSTRERLRRFVDRYILAPLRIGWSDWRTRVGGLGILFYILMGTVGVVLVKEPELNEGPRKLPAFIDWSVPLGTNSNGEGIFGLIVHATPAMLKMATGGALTTVLAGVIIGFIGGYKGGIVDRIMMTITDIQAVLPGLPLIIVLSGIFADSMRDPFVVGVVLAIDTWPGLARAIRSQVLTLREEDYVEAGRSLGLSSSTIIRQDLFPQLAPYILVNMAGAATRVLKASVALYFLSILPVSTLNWGVIMNNAYDQGQAVSQIGAAGHWLFFPAVALSGMTFVFVLFAQGLDRVFNPRLRARHAQTTPDEDDEPQASGEVM
ncbi:MULTISPECIES: ABC transporter permease [unclassified Halorhabdus]|uniref:ABC transporter permease n=1 Tax=unclassified Halorhabdus TaxID=2621901 RepID=UPI0023DBA7A2|nr:MULTISPECIES: ABC transporter permease [unclassified Halorhabdus]WEL18586.1 ABC-type dipeptide/oligopeptide/nickel transportsystem, permease component [Halorhabdus sp. SVX81]WEL22474.1 ABC-type dipeptide/oligopeptide/nickel transport system, permease component [Halorhabdus sp. BNX81]